jgi:transposase
MDPTACYLEMFRAMNEGDWATARERALALHQWLDRGGFHPPNYTEVEVRSYLASVLRRTAGIEPIDDGEPE